MVEQRPRPAHPYQPTPPAHSPLFVGREDFFAWLQFNLNEPPPHPPLALYGEAGIGKTALLRQIEQDAVRFNVVTIFVQLPARAVDSVSAFYWELAQTALPQLSRQKYDLPALNQATFIADPAAAFNQHILRPLQSGLDGRHILLLFDDVDVIAGQLDKTALPSSLLEDLYYLISQTRRGHCLFTLTGTTMAELLPPLSFLAKANRYQLGPLTEAETISLIRQPANDTIVKDVAHYMYNLTGGHPYDLQLLCHALHERRQAHNLNHLTIADVVFVKQVALKTAALQANGPAGRPSYSVNATPTLIQTVRTEQVPASLHDALRLRLRTKPIPLILTLLALLILTALLALFLSRWTKPGQPQSFTAADDHTTPTGTAVAAAANTAERLVIAGRAATATTTPTPTATTEATATATAVPSRTLTPTPTVWPTATIRSRDGMVMVLIPAGTFVMGARQNDALAGPDEKPEHEVTLDPFYIDKYEVSVAQYAAFLNRLGSYDKACHNFDCTLPRERIGYTSYLMEQDLGDGTRQYAALTGFANYPANHITWYGADAYCRSVGARLPTEAEWEYAARGTDGRLYPWGNEQPTPRHAVYQSNSFDNLKPVDALPDGASPFGVFGMAGSVWEWTADWYDERYYQHSPAVNPTGPEFGLTRAVRGGAWPNNNQADRIRATNRSALSPDLISATVGFRCAMTP